ncbi:unnamed protein product, partial [marine sediment metagenome]
GPDLAGGAWGPTQWLSPMQERPIMGDFEKYGPRGTDEYAFRLTGCYVPEQYLRGWLLEDWEVTLEKLVWHVRPGIYWMAIDGVMEARELVAQDIVDDILYLRDCPAGVTFRHFTGDIYVTDRYTLEIEFTKFDLTWIFWLGYEDRALITAPEMLTAPGGADSWDNQTGTGPFKLREYVVGSHMTFDRNPNWWKTTVIDGVEYELPFIDELVMPMILDEATWVSALRTGKVDYDWTVATPQWENLDKTTPELLSSRTEPSGGNGLYLQCTQPPFDDVDVRRAMMVGTDMGDFAALAGLEGLVPLHWYPLSPGHPESLYTPLEKLPAETKLLYDYNPTLAKQMLADAGYPNGFKVYVTSGPS